VHQGSGSRLAVQDLDETGDHAFDVIILLSSARMGISFKFSSLTRVQSMPVGAALGRLMRIAWVGVAITLSG
jgi:hypothetical protein